MDRNLRVIRTIRTIRTIHELSRKPFYNYDVAHAHAHTFLERMCKVERDETTGIPGRGSLLSHNPRTDDRTFAEAFSCSCVTLFVTSHAMRELGALSGKSDSRRLFCQRA